MGIGGALGARYRSRASRVRDLNSRSPCQSARRPHKFPQKMVPGTYKSGSIHRTGGELKRQARPRPDGGKERGISTPETRAIAAGVWDE